MDNYTGFSDDTIRHYIEVRRRMDVAIGGQSLQPVYGQGFFPHPSITPAFGSYQSYSAGRPYGYSSVMDDPMGTFARDWMRGLFIRPLPNRT